MSESRFYSVQPLKRIPCFQTEPAHHDELNEPRKPSLERKIWPIQSLLVGKGPQRPPPNEWTIALMRTQSEMLKTHEKVKPTFADEIGIFFLYIYLRDEPYRTVQVRRNIVKFCDLI